MNKRTTTDIDIEIDDLDLEILEIKRTISEDGPDCREEHRKKTRDIGPGYIPLADRRKHIAILERKRKRLEDERAALVSKSTATSGKKFGHGELKKKIVALVRRDGFKVDDTVPPKIRAKWLREIEKEGYTTTAGAIRAELAKLFITKQRKAKQDD